MSNDPAGEGVPIRLSDLAATVAERRSALGDTETPRNAGDRRTESKRALLEAIGKTGARW